MSSLKNTYPIPDGQNLMAITDSCMYQWKNFGVLATYVACGDALRIVTATAACAGGMALAYSSGLVQIVNKNGVEIQNLRLNNASGSVISLALAPDFQTLYLATSLQNNILQYDILGGRIREISSPHASRISVLAASKSFKFLISASRSPPSLKVHDLASDSFSTPVTPRASPTAITSGVFHREIEEYFALAFEDGVVSVHAASRIVLLHRLGSDGHISRYKRCHSGSNPESSISQACKDRSYLVQSQPGQKLCKAFEICALEFLIGYKLRIVALTRNGTCRIIDFAAGAELIRTWQVGAICTSLSSLRASIPPLPTLYPVQKKKKSQKCISTGHLIAIGRADGRISLFDSLGLCRMQKITDYLGRPILQVHWSTVADAVGTVLVDNVESRNNTLVNSQVPHGAASQALATVMCDNEDGSKSDVPVQATMEDSSEHVSSSKRRKNHENEAHSASMTLVDIPDSKNCDSPWVRTPKTRTELVRDCSTNLSFVTAVEHLNDDTCKGSGEEELGISNEASSGPNSPPVCRYAFKRITRPKHGTESKVSPKCDKSSQSKIICSSVPGLQENASFSSDTPGSPTGDSSLYESKLRCLNRHRKRLTLDEIRTTSLPRPILSSAVGPLLNENYQCSTAHEAVSKAHFSKEKRTDDTMNADIDIKCEEDETGVAREKKQMSRGECTNTPGCQTEGQAVQSRIRPVKHFSVAHCKGTTPVTSLVQESRTGDCSHTLQACHQNGDKSKSLLFEHEKDLQCEAYTSEVRATICPQIKAVKHDIQRLRKDVMALQESVKTLGCKERIYRDKTAPGDFYREVDA